jgi:hypothetical protein
MVFLFNVGGYYVVFWTMQISGENQLSLKLDHDRYSDYQVFLFKLPLTLPYSINQEGYQRVEGSFEHAGQFYQLVKQKLENDTLFIVCIKDHEKKRVADAFSNYTKLSHDLPTSHEEGGLNLLSKLSKEFENNILLEIVMTDGWFLSRLYAERQPNLLSNENNTPSPPPKV